MRRGIMVDFRQSYQTGGAENERVFFMSERVRIRSYYEKRLLRSGRTAVRCPDISSFLGGAVHKRQPGRGRGISERLFFEMRVLPELFSQS